MPTENAARIALRTQQIVAHETGVTNVADPLGGSHYVEWMTDEMERQAEAIFAHVEELGEGSMLEGAYVGIDNGYFVGEIADAAYRFEREINSGRRIVVGVNEFTDGDDNDNETLYIGAEVEEYQLKRLANLKRDRDDEAVRRALDEIVTVASTPDQNTMPAFIAAAKVYVTEGEIVAALEGVYGTYVETAVV